MHIYLYYFHIYAYMHVYVYKYMYIFMSKLIHLLKPKIQIAAKAGAYYPTFIEKT